MTHLYWAVTEVWRLQSPFAGGRANRDGGLRVPHRPLRLHPLPDPHLPPLLLPPAAQRPLRQVHPRHLRLSGTFFQFAQESSGVRFFYSNLSLTRFILISRVRSHFS